jgi:hypothetical protein
MVHAKYHDEFHKGMRERAKIYYNPIVKSLRYYAKKLKLTTEDLENRFGGNVFEDDGAAIQARDVLKVEIAKEKLQKTLELQQAKYDEYLAELDKKSHELEENIKIVVKPSEEQSANLKFTTAGDQVTGTKGEKYWLENGVRTPLRQ